MAHYPLISVYDAAVLSYMPPFQTRTVGEAKRQLVDTMADPSHPFTQHPEDYTLVQVGTFNDATGEITSITPPVVLMKADEALAIGEKNNG